jgi:hypothetical protein
MIRQEASGWNGNSSGRSTLRQIVRAGPGVHDPVVPIWDRDLRLLQLFGVGLDPPAVALRDGGGTPRPLEPEPAPRCLRNRVVALCDGTSKRVRLPVQAVKHTGSRVDLKNGLTLRARRCRQRARADYPTGGSVGFRLCRWRTTGQQAEATARCDGDPDPRDGNGHKFYRYAGFVLKFKA